MAFITTSSKIVQLFLNMINIKPVVVKLYVNVFNGTSFDAVLYYLFAILPKQIPKYKRNTITLLKMLRTFSKQKR